jgi:YidC/Oxa1 family membrane protein insertase
MDRKSWIAITLSVAGLFAWQWYVSKYYKPQLTQATATTASATPAPMATPAADSTPLPTPPAEATIAARAESLSNENAEFTFNSGTGGIEQVVLRMHKGENESHVSLNRSRSMPIGGLGFNPGEVLGGFEMATDPAKGEATFSSKQSGGLEITKRFAVPMGANKEKPYAITLDVTFKNPGTAPLQVPEFFIGTGGAAPLHVNDLPMYTCLNWAHGGSMTNIDVNWFSASSVPIIGIPIHDQRPLYEETKPDIEWVAVTSQYFCTIITPKDATQSHSVWSMRFDAPKLNDTANFGIQGGLKSRGFTLAAGEVVTRSFEIYAGPKELPLLRKLGATQDKVMNFGIFGFVSEFLLWSMNGLHVLLGNYAASIIVLTILIKSVLWPVQNKATKEMRKMASLSPKMTEMREKHKDNPQKLNEETMKLYKEYGVNPFSGCLPMLIQIPIFFGFYAMLGTAIELRNSSFFWVVDLSQPDTITHLLGFPINILPLLMAGTMVWQMIITPKTGDAMQQRIFYFMPIIFLVFCYNYASGLALYWTTQNLFSIVQLYFTRNQPLPTLEKKSTIAKREAQLVKKKSKKPPTS